MKKLLLIILGISISLFGFTQKKIDRSKAPKPGPAPTITINDPAIFKLENGITILVVEDHKLPRVAATLSIDKGPVVEGIKAGVNKLMGQMLGEGTKNTPKDQFDERIDFMGANVSFNASGGYASSLSRYFDSTFKLMAEAIKDPAFESESLEKLKSMAITDLKSKDKNASAISERVVSALNFGKSSAQGEFETEESIQGITVADINNAYREGITPSRCYITFVGDINADSAKLMTERAFGSWQGVRLGIPEAANADTLITAEIDFIDVPSAVQGEIFVGNLIKNPLSNPEYHALMIANQILGGGAESKLFMNLREKHGFTYGSYSKVGNSRFQSLFSANAQVRNEKADSAVMEILHEIENMRNGNITEEELQNAKAKYNGSIALAMENPENTALYASNILINNLPKDFYKIFLQKINAVTLEDVQRVSRTYFALDNCRIILVGSGSKILPNLSKLKLPIRKYDRFANPIIDKTSQSNDPKEQFNSKSVITAASVILVYLKAIGGRPELRKLNTLKSTFTINMMGINLSGTDIKMAPNKRYTQIKMGDSLMMESIFDGTKGRRSQMGQANEIDQNEIKENLDNKGIIPQLFYLTSDYKIDYMGTERLDDQPVHKLKITKPSGKIAYEYYSVKSGFLMRDETTTSEDNSEVNVYIDFGNYKPVGNLVLPYEITQVANDQQIIMKVNQIKINEDVTEDNFKY